MNFFALSNNSWIGRLARAPLKLIPKNAVVSIRHGKLRGTRWVVGSGTHGCWLGTYERDMQDLFSRTISSGTVVYDVGANVGFYTLLASKLTGKNGRVVAFEPVPRNLTFLKRHLALNKCDNVNVIEAAVARTSGIAQFDGSRGPLMGKLSEAGALSVRVVVLDELLATREIIAPDLIKIDVEGAELTVLHGARQIIERYRPVIFVAMHSDDLRERCNAFLAQYRYGFEPVTKAGDVFLAQGR